MRRNLPKRLGGVASKAKGKLGSMCPGRQVEKVLQDRSDPVSHGTSRSCKKRTETYLLT